MLPGLDIFAYEFMQRALIAGLLVALVAGSLGVFLVLRGSAMYADGLGHVAFGGVALGLIANVYPLGMALAFALFAGIAIQLLRERGIVLNDTAIAIFFTSGLALGVLLVSAGPGFSVDLFSYLFGSLLTVTARDIQVIAVLAVITGAVLVLLFKELFFVTMGEDDARAAGLPVRALNLLFASLTSVAVVVTARVVGVLLVSALFVLPAATALLGRRGFRGTILTSVALATAAVVGGLYASYVFDLATGASIAMMSVGLFFLSLFGHAAVRATRRSL